MGVVVRDELVDELFEQAGGKLELLGPDGLIAQLTKRVLEKALDAELTEHLGYEKYDPNGRNSGNSRNGSTPKTLHTDAGPVELAVPRDRAGSFEPKIVAKHQTRLEGFERAHRLAVRPRHDRS